LTSKIKNTGIPLPTTTTTTITTNPPPPPFFSPVASFSSHDRYVDIKCGSGCTKMHPNYLTWHVLAKLAELLNNNCQTPEAGEATEVTGIFLTMENNLPVHLQKSKRSFTLTFIGFGKIVRAAWRKLWCFFIYLFTLLLLFCWFCWYSVLQDTQKYSLPIIKSVCRSCRRFSD
jgi:hypothetical protein